MRIYRGDRDGNVTVNRRALNPRLDIYNHSSAGFAWGYGGSGPAQLALAVLADCVGDDDIALAFHQAFKRSVVEPLPAGEPWELNERAALMALGASDANFLYTLLDDVLDGVDGYESECGDLRDLDPYWDPERVAIARRVRDAWRRREKYFFAAWCRRKKRFVTDDELPG